MRPADQSHGRGWGQPPPTRSQPPHSLPVCARVSLTLSAPRTHRKTSSPSPSLPWKRVHPAGLRRERPEVPLWGEKGGGGRNSTCWGPPRNSVKLLHSHSAPSLTPFHAQLTQVPPSLLSTHTRCSPHACASLHNTPFLFPPPHLLPHLPLTWPPHPFISPGPCSSLLLPSPAFHGKGLLAQAWEKWQEACLCKDTLTF